MKENYSIDVLMQAIARILGGAITFVSVYLYTYIFNESIIGQYNIVLSTINIIASLGTLWLSQSILRFYDKDDDFGMIISFSLISVIICLVTFFIFNLLYSCDINLWSYLYVVIIVLYNIFDAVFRRSRRLYDYVLLELLLSFSKVFPMILITRIYKNYDSIFMSQCIVTSLFFLFLIIKHRSVFVRSSYKISFNNLYKYLHFGVPLMGLAISNWFLTTSDRYIIKYFGNDSQVGIYSTNYSLANSIYMMFSLIIINAYHPILMKKWSESKEDTYKLLSHTIDLYLMVMIPITFYGCLKSSVLLSLFNGNLYQKYNSVFNWTAIGIFFYGLSLLLHKYYEFEEKTKNILIINLIAALANIIMNICLIPVFGFAVASFTTFLSYIIYIVIVRVSTYKKCKIYVNLRKMLLVIIIVFIFFMIDRMFIHSSSIISFFVEGFLFCVYVFIMYQVTGVLKLKDIYGK